MQKKKLAANETITGVHVYAASFFFVYIDFRYTLIMSEVFCMPLVTMGQYMILQATGHKKKSVGLAVITALTPCLPGVHTAQLSACGLGRGEGHPGELTSRQSHQPHTGCRWVDVLKNNTSCTTDSLVY